MNENIKELAVKAGYLADQDYDLDFYAYEWFDIKVFAELIVNECCDVVINSDPSPKMILHEPYRTIMNNIQEHFEVKE